MSSLTENNSSLKKSSPSSQQQRLKAPTNAPVYNPTPILVLKKFQPTPETTEKSGFKRKTETEDNNQNQDHADVDKTEIDESLQKKKKVEPTVQDTVLSPPPKIDMISFGKLKPSQQLLKRYEMLNKPIKLPSSSTLTASALSVARSKQLSDNMAKDKSVPHLIMDSSSLSGSKVPIAMRQRYLKFIFDNGKSACSSVEKACEKAAEQEKSVYDRSKNKAIYMNLSANLIKSLRDQSGISEADSSKSAVCVNRSPTKLASQKLASSQQYQKQKQVTTYSHEALLSGPKASRVSFSINRVKQIEIKDLTAQQLYQVFYSYILTEAQLDENSFPTWQTTVNNINTNKPERLACIPYFKSNFTNKTSSSDKDTKKDTSLTIASIIESDSQESSIDKYTTKICKRCQKTFQITSKSFIYSPSNSDCVHHWGKLRTQRQYNKAIEQRYSCCSGSSGDSGCETGQHVYDGDYDGNGEGLNVEGYVETTSSHKHVTASSNMIFALDCEMCYTTRGLELARVSIVDVNLKEVYESLVKPDHQILDYNTRWSGLTEESLRNCRKGIKQVQQELLKIFMRETILIGHSLDSDFKALKLIHKTVIDTSVVFPHKMGPPIKRALRNLMSEHLQKTIQEDVEGHDSKEDANACIELMNFKISEDLKLKKPAFLSELPAAVPVPSPSIPQARSCPIIATSSSSDKRPIITSSNKSSQHHQKPKPHSSSLSHVLSPQAIAKAKMLAKSQSSYLHKYI
jgi:RNA exonuclease 1